MYYDEEEIELVEHNARLALAKCSLELAEYHDDDLDMELAESNARVAKCNLAEYEEEKAKVKYAGLGVAMAAKLMFGFWFVLESS